MSADKDVQPPNKTLVSQNEKVNENYVRLPSPIPLNADSALYLRNTIAQSDLIYTHAKLTENWIHTYNSVNMTAFGHYLPCNNEFLFKETNSQPSLSIDYRFPKNKPEFKIVKKIGNRSYHAVHVPTGRFYFAKTNNGSRRNIALPVEKEWWVNIYHREFFEHHRSHICNFDAIYYLSEIRCRIFLRPLMDNLQDLITSCILLGRSSAMMLAIETFEAIHDLHTHGFLHRDIRPVNFLVGRGKNYKLVYMFNFSSSCSFDPRYVHFESNSTTIIKNAQTPPRMRKSRYYDWRFACRNYHLSKPFTKMFDIESWLYMTLYFFHREFIPWYCKHPNSVDVDPKDSKPGDESDVFNMKNLFFAGCYDHLYTSMGGFIQSMRGWIVFKYSNNVSSDIVDYPYGIFLLSELQQKLGIADAYESMDWVGVDENSPNKIIISKNDVERKKVLGIKVGSKELSKETVWNLSSEEDRPAKGSDKTHRKHAKPPKLSSRSPTNVRNAQKNVISPGTKSSSFSEKKHVDSAESVKVPARLASANVSMNRTKTVKNPTKSNEDLTKPATKHSLSFRKPVIIEYRNSSSPEVDIVTANDIQSTKTAKIASQSFKEGVSKSRRHLSEPEVKTSISDKNHINSVKTAKPIPRSAYKNFSKEYPKRRSAETSSPFIKRDADSARTAKKMTVSFKKDADKSQRNAKSPESNYLSTIPTCESTETAKMP
uniref:Protein kinase domain-containing protein n=1 Tax=Panagrellus redivivus TaxID=6233 RepID=A0A7E4UNX1_PANRE